MNSLLTRTCLLIIPLFAASCDDTKVTAYRIPKEKETPAESVASGMPASANMSAPLPTPAGGSMASSPMATAAGPGLVWIAPSAWTVKPSGAMRKGSYAVAGEGGAAADLSITAFPGDVGGENANVNRWRSQLQLQPVTEEEVAGVITRLAANDLKIALVEFSNPSTANPTRLLGAMVPYGGATWFFKLLGPDRVVASNKPAFLEFLKTIKPAAASPTP
jgi:hypothetical protein